jgi:hypothetical protein
MGDIIVTGSPAPQQTGPRRRRQPRAPHANPPVERISFQGRFHRLLFNVFHRSYFFLFSTCHYLRRRLRRLKKNKCDWWKTLKGSLMGKLSLSTGGFVWGARGHSRSRGPVRWGVGEPVTKNAAHGSLCVLGRREGSVRKGNGWLWRLLGGSEWRGGLWCAGRPRRATAAAVPFGGAWMNLKQQRCPWQSTRWGTS